MLLNKADVPLKQSTSSPEDPPKASQKSEIDCHRSVSLEEVDGNPALPCRDVANGEFSIGVSLQVFHTCVQKSPKVSLDWAGPDEADELQRMGTVRNFGSVLNRSAENGLHFCDRTKI